MNTPFPYRTVLCFPPNRPTKSRDERGREIFTTPLSFCLKKTTKQTKNNQPNSKSTSLLQSWNQKLSPRTPKQEQNKGEQGKVIPLWHFLGAVSHRSFIKKRLGWRSSWGEIQKLHHMRDSHEGLCTTQCVIFSLEENTQIFETGGADRWWYSKTNCTLNKDFRRWESANQHPHNCQQQEGGSHEASSSNFQETKYCQYH